MKFPRIEIQQTGVEMALNPARICFAAKMPLQQVFNVGVVGAVMEANAIKTPFDQFCDDLMSNAFPETFLMFPIPEGTDAIVNPKNILFVVNPPDELTKSVIMFPNGVKLIVSEGFETTMKKLQGESIIETA